MNATLDIKQLMNILSKHAAKSLLLLILTSFLIACAEEEEEKEIQPDNRDFAEIISPIFAKGEFKTNPDLKNFASQAESDECFHYDLARSFLGDGVSEETKAAISTDFFIRFYFSGYFTDKTTMLGIATAIANCRTENENVLKDLADGIAAQYIDGNVHTVSDNDKTVSIQIKLNERIKSLNSLVNDASVFMNRVSLSSSWNINTKNVYTNNVWLADDKGNTISSVSLLGGYAFDKLSLTITKNSSLVVAQESSDGVFKVYCQLITTKFVCYNYRYDAKNGDFDGGQFSMDVQETAGKMAMQKDTANTIQFLGNFDKTNEQHVYAYRKSGAQDATPNVQPLTLEIPTFTGFSPTTKAFNVDKAFELLASTINNFTQSDTKANIATSLIELKLMEDFLGKNYTHRSETSETNDAVIKFYGKEAISAQQQLQQTSNSIQ